MLPSEIQNTPQFYVVRSYGAIQMHTHTHLSTYMQHGATGKVS